MDPDDTLTLPPPHLLFASITYYIAPSFPPLRIEELDAVLQEYGGNRAEGGVKDEKLTTVISNSARWEGWEEVGEEGRIDVVTDKWVERSVVLGKLQSAHHFSTNPALIFSGVVACSTSDLPPTDLEVLSAGIIALGGQWRTGLTKDVTHLFALTPNSGKYATAMHYQETTRIKVVLPHWFDDAVRLGTGKLGTEPYEWPEVRVLKGVDGLLGGPEENEVKRNMYATAAIFTPTMGQTTPPLQEDINLLDAATADRLASSPVNGVNRSALALQPGEGVWAGRKIMLSRTLQLYHGRRGAVQAGIERAGGVVLRFDGDGEEEEASIELPPEKGKEAQGPRYKLHMNERRRRRSEAEKIDQCDVLVTRWRFGRAYVLAVRSAKTIGTLAWLFHVQSTGILSRPLDQLLHYPVPKKPIEAFYNHVVTVTNYTGEAREYLKKLISAMGASFTPSMSGQNTVLIAAYTSGTKAAKARSWSIPVVNHTWLEDCFVQWRNLTPALEKYIVFPEGVDFARMLGERGVFVGPIGGGNKIKANNDDQERFEIPKDRIELEAEELYIDGELEVASDVEMGPPSASDGLANGVEEAEVLEELGMDVDEDRGGDGTAPKPTTKPAQPTPSAKGGKVSKPTPKPTAKSKPISKSTELADEVIEFNSSGSDAEGALDAWVKKNGKGKAKVTEDEVEAEEPRIVEKTKSPSKRRTKPTKSKHELALDNEGDEEEPLRLSKTAKSKTDTGGLILKKRLPLSSVESDEPQEDKIESGAEDKEFEEEHEELQIKAKAKKLKRRFSVASVPDNDDAEDEEEEEEKKPQPKTKPKPKPIAKPTKPAKPTPKSKKRQPIPPPASSSENEEESVVVISKTKTKTKSKVSPAKSTNVASGSAVKPGDQAPTPSAGGLLNRVRGDARTRVKKRVSKGGEKPKARVVESEDDEEEEEEDEVPKGKSKAKGKAKGKKAVTPSASEPEEEDRTDDDEEEEEQKTTRASGSKTKPKATSKATTTPTRTKPLRVYSENDEDDSENSEEVEKEFPSPHLAFSKATATSASAKKTAKTTSTSKSKPKSKAVVEPPSTKSKSKAKVTKPAVTESESGTESDAPLPSTKKNAKAKDGKKATGQTSPSTPRRVMSVLMPTLSISGRTGRGEQKEKGKGKKRVIIDDEENVEEDEEEEVTLKGKSRARVKGVAAPDEREEKSKTNKAKAKPDPKTRTKSDMKSKSKSKRPRETSDEEDTTNEDQEVNAPVSPRTRAMTRTDSMRVVSAHVAIPSLSVATATRKAKAKGTTKVAKEKEKGSTVQHRYRQRPPSPSAESDSPMDVDSHPVASTSAPTNALAPSTSSSRSTPGSSAVPRRSAATKATQKLHETIMPDVMQYEAQMKRSRSKKGRGSAAAAFVVEGDGGKERKEKEREKEKRKHADDGDERSKKKRRVSEDSQEGVKAVEAKGKSKIPKGKERTGGVPMDVDDDDANSSAKVRVMTTQISLGDDVTKALLKLGVTFTTRPGECTHLIAQGVVRTEKFLCALAMRSYILSEKWAIASADAKNLLPEKDFLLKDKVGEEKYNVDLARALRLSKQNKGRLLQGHTFYVTPRVSIDTKLLKNVVNACGGQVTTQAPTLRIINASPETRHVISCKEDLSIWRPLAAQGIKVYTQELVLEGTLRQEMDWDKERFLVKV